VPSSIQDLIDWFKKHLPDSTIQIDPLSATVAFLSLLVAILALTTARRAHKQTEQIQDSLGRIKSAKVFLPAWILSDRRGKTTVLGGTVNSGPGKADPTVCSIYSGSTPVEVERVDLTFTYSCGLMHRSVFHMTVDFEKGEGLVEPAPSLPVRMDIHDRLDWKLLQLAPVWPYKHNYLTLEFPSFVLKPLDNLTISLAAYAKTSIVPVTHRIHFGLLAPLPPIHFRWARHYYYNSVLAMLEDDAAPVQLKSAFMAWVGLRSDIEEILQKLGELPAAEHIAENKAAAPKGNRGAGSPNKEQTNAADPDGGGDEQDA
jgi:hypothetical protein